MDKTKALELILVEWIASLKSKDRSAKNLKPNFEELFESWQQQEASFDDLYNTLLPKAIKAHHPAPSVIKGVFSSFKKNIKSFNKNEKEFTEDWLKSISDTATQLFFEYFPPPILNKENNEPKIYGNMTAKEYNLQRRYIEQFPILDTTELEKQWKEEREMLDLNDLLKNVLGNQNEDNN